MDEPTRGSGWLFTRSCERLSLLHLPQARLAVKFTGTEITRTSRDAKSSQQAEPTGPLDEPSQREMLWGIYTIR
jgi:hypothetical protein